MSYAGAPRQYFCHQCNLTISISPSVDILCPNCNTNFIQEVEIPIFSFESEFGSGGQTLRTDIQIVIDSSARSSGPFSLPESLSREHFIQQLAENPYGTSPASKSAIEGLPNIKISEELLASDSSQCAVCKDTFERGEEAKQMPCKHIYHSDCILPWLKLQNTCPICRYELPPDNPVYEQWVRWIAGREHRNQSAEARGSSDSSEGGSNVGTVSVPWRSSQRTSNAETNDISRNSGGQSNPGNGGNQNFEPETTPEDLD